MVRQLRAMLAVSSVLAVLTGCGDVETTERVKVRVPMTTTTTTIGFGDAAAFVTAVLEFVAAVDAQVRADEEVIHPPAAAAASCAIPAHICARESGFDPTVVSANGLWHGKYQFVQATFDYAVAGAGFPEWVGVAPELVPEWVQDAAAGWLWSTPDGPCHWGEGC